MVDKELERCERSRRTRSRLAGEGVDNENEETSHRNDELFMPLRQLLGSLRRLERLHTCGTSPFGCAVSELPTVKVGAGTHVSQGAVCS